ncbi:MAG: hypothetical protein QOD53_1388 [Thermoleophilaceae bacterium]|jgi:uncharacterized cupin superfamily protein|nr:hypothetical protein [Thermoleophilaceae bacterium]
MSDRNIFEPDFDAEQDKPPFSWRRARLGRQAGTEKLGASLFELEPGASSFPLHVHHANEELLMVLAGTPTLRTLDGERELATGEVVAFPSGRGGAHRIDNRSAEPARFAIVSTMISPEVNEYPDSDKIWVRSFAPGADGPEDALDVLAHPDPDLGYMDGER